ncbi:hypothetical protein B0H14DRAFT_62233 [Mycena olivaceomarginata]|nr:hypothetical protein B0H14DRAFT_62233 [Mycena olivaceomarginata]
MALRLFLARSRPWPSRFLSLGAPTPVALRRSGQSRTTDPVTVTISRALSATEFLTNQVPVSLTLRLSNTLPPMACGDAKTPYQTTYSRLSAVITMEISRTMSESPASAKTYWLPGSWYRNYSFSSQRFPQQTSSNICTLRLRHVRYGLAVELPWVSHLWLRGILGGAVRDEVSWRPRVVRTRS